MFSVRSAASKAKTKPPPPTDSSSSTMKLWCPGVCPGVESAVTPGRDLDIAVGELPVVPRVVEVDPVHGVALRLGVAATGRTPARAAGQWTGAPTKCLSPPAWSTCRWLRPTALTRRNLDAGEGKRLLQRLPLARQHDGVGRVAVEPPSQRGVPDQRGVEAGVEQHPAAVAAAAGCPGTGHTSISPGGAPSTEIALGRCSQPRVSSTISRTPGPLLVMPSRSPGWDTGEAGGSRDRSHPRRSGRGAVGQPAVSAARCRLNGAPMSWAASTPLMPFCATMKSLR